MNYAKFNTAKRIFSTALHQCQRAGIDVSSVNAGNQLMTTLCEVLPRDPRARAFDGRMKDVIKRDELQVNPADEYDEGRGLDQEDLGALRDMLELGLQRYKPASETATFIKKLRMILDSYLQRGNDADLLRGRGQRDMDSPPSRNAFASWEPGMTGQDRAHLRRSRELAARATDRAPVGRSFLSMMAEPGSDLARLDAQASENFGLI